MNLRDFEQLISLFSITQKLFSIGNKFYNFTSNLNENQKRQFHDAFVQISRFCLKIWNFLASIYPRIMRFGSREIDQFSQPPHFLLLALASVSLFVFPVKQEWQFNLSANLDLDNPSASVSASQESTQSRTSHLSKENMQARKNTIYIGNQQLYSLGTISLLSAIYKTTSTLPRTLLPSFHFKIPIWKHFIEVFGCVPDTEDALEKIVQAGHTPLFFPGGLKSYLTPLDPSKPYSFDTFHPQALTRLVSLLKSNPHHSITCFTNVGASDMFYTHSLPLPFTKGTDYPSSISFIVPTSYQRQYIVFSPPLTCTDITPPPSSSSSSSTNPSDPSSYMFLLKKMGSVRSDTLDLQHLDSPHKYLLTSITTLARKISQSRLVKTGVEGFAGVGGRVVEAGSERLRRSVSMRTVGAPGPVIKEILEE